MFKLKQSLAAAACLLLAFALAAVVGPRTGYGQKAAAQPSPVPPPLNVNVVNTPLPVTGAVSVGNTADSPVPVRDVGAPAKRLVSVTGEVPLHDNALFVVANIAYVPAGKRFVIEAASAHLNLPEGQVGSVLFQTNSDSSLGAPGPPQLTNNYLTVTFQQTATEYGELRNYYVGTEKVLAVAEPDTNIRLGFGRNTFGGTGSGRVTLTGYVEDLPQQ
jgi:hypothetical protein